MSNFSLINKQQNNSCEVMYSVKKGETAYSIARRNSMPLKTLQTLNPGINLNNIAEGQKLKLKTAAKQTTTPQKPKTSGRISKPALPQKKLANTSLFSIKDTSERPLTSFSSSQNKTTLPKQQAAMPKPSNVSSNILTLEKFEKNLPPEAKLAKPFVKASEGNKTNIYIASDGKATIGNGHALVNKPKFLTDIEKKSLTPKEKNKLIKTALLKKENQIALKQSLQQDLLDAIKTTGIKNVASTINSNLSLTNNQIELLLMSDIKIAQDAMTKTFGKEVLSKKTANQKLVLLDMYFNVGRNLKSKAPEFVKQFKAGNIEAAQAELNIFKADNKVSLGLIRRSYRRMLLLNDNKLSPLAKERLLAAYNEYMKEHNGSLAQNFAKAEENLKRA